MAVSKLHRSHIDEASRRGHGGAALRVFDFDDTLVQHDSRVLIRDEIGNIRPLSSGEFAIYKLAPGESYDFSEFERSINVRMITWTVRILRKIYAKYGARGLTILTARDPGRCAPVYEFLVDAGLPDIKVVGVGSSRPEDKSDWIAWRISHGDISYVEFFDDSVRNIAAVQALQDRYPDVEIVVRHIKH